MGSPEPKQRSAELDADDLDFAWDDSFPIRPPPPKSSGAEEAPAKGSSPPPHPRLRAANSFPPNATPLPLDSSPAVAIDEMPDSKEPRARERMITLPDEDPLRYDVGYSKDRDITRDSMPTIPDINPLRYDVASDPESASERQVAAPDSGQPKNPA